jgi:hypothetical protein
LNEFYLQGYDTVEEIKSRLNSNNACYYSVQNIFSFYVLSKNMKITIYKTIILSVGFYGFETCSLILREVNTCRLRVFEIRVLRRIFGNEMLEVWIKNA